jgi:hypothetical protein
MRTSVRRSRPRRRARSVSLETVRWRLAMTWFLGCGAIFLVLVAQSFTNAYGSEVRRAWAWALPNFLPTLALMVSVFAADALRPAERDAAVRRNFADLALVLSGFYLVAVLFSLIGQPLHGLFADAPSPVAARLALLEMSNLWLGPLQSLVIAAIGVVFFLRDTKPASGNPPPN